MKKLLATLLATTMALSAVGGLVACGEAEPEKVAATAISLTNVYGQAVTEVTIAPDGSLGVMAKVTPANATSEVTWAIKGTNNVTVKPGGLNNTQAFLACTDYTSGEAVTLTATIDGKSVSIPVTVNDWTRFMAVGGGTPISWSPESAAETTLFVQDATDKHKWTYVMNIPDVLPDGGFKIVAAAEVLDETDPDFGKIKGLGWNGGYNLGIDNQKPDVPAEGETDTPEQAAARKKQAITGNSGVLNIVNDGGSGNINIASAAEAGKYRFTLKTKVGGGFDSLSYERIGDAE